MMVVRSTSMEKVIWHVRSLLPQLESTPMTLARRHVGNYVIRLCTLGYLYTALSSCSKRWSRRERWQTTSDSRLHSRDGPEESYITTTPLPR